MNSIKNILIENGIINDVFEYHDIDSELADTYAYFETKFQSLFREYANVFNIKNDCFYIRNDNSCNAFASKREDYNIIGVNNGYPILMKRKFNEKYFSMMLLVAFFNEQSISEAYCDLEEDPNFKFNEFMLDCSIEFTFGHEFRHILQLNSSKTVHDFRYSENLDKTGFKIEKHAREFDADRMGSFQVLKHIFRVYRKLKNKNDENFKCMLYIGLASVIITKNLFYFNVMNQLPPMKIIANKQDFYTKKFSHPHPLVRINNIFEFFMVTIMDDFPKLKIEPQQVLVNVFGIVQIYFDSLIPNQKLRNDLIKGEFKQTTQKFHRILTNPLFYKV